MTPRLRRATDGPAADDLRRLAVEHPDWSSTQVHRELELRQGRGTLSLRTVQRFLAEFPPDASGEWTMAEDVPEDSAIILSVARWLTNGGWPPVRWPTKTIAQWVVRIFRAFPDLDDPQQLFRLALEASRDAKGIGHVQAYLAYTPWRDRGAALFQAVANGRIAMPPVLDDSWDLQIEYMKWLAEHEPDTVTMLVSDAQD